METNGINEQTHGYIAFRQDDATWVELAEALDYLCLLYTSDAADDVSTV